MQIKLNLKWDKEDNIKAIIYKNDFCLFQFHKQIEIYFVDEGEMDLLVDGERKLLNAPAVSIAMSYDTHLYKTPNTSRSSVLIIPSQLCDEFNSALRGKRIAEHFITDRQIYEELKACFWSIRENKSNRLKQLGFAYQALGILLERATFVEADKSSDTELASQLLFYIEENYSSDISPSTIARHFGYNQSYLSRYFSMLFGVTMSRYITAVRLRNTISLMREGKHDITYCAMESGFSTMRTFYRVFRNEFGMTPTDFIKAENESLG